MRKSRRRSVLIATIVLLLTVAAVTIAAITTSLGWTLPLRAEAPEGAAWMVSGGSWRAIALTSAVVTVLALLIAILLYRGRRALLRAPVYVWPEDHARLLESVVRSNESAAEALGAVTLRQQSASQELSHGMAQLHSAFVTMHSALDQREKEIAALRAGYETTVVKRVARRLLGVAQLLERRNDDGDARQTLDSAGRLMQDLLEELGVSRFEPELGAKYPTVSGVEDSPEEQPTSAPEEDLTIAQVIQPGYKIEQADRTSVVLKQARIKIYRYAETGA